jgi:hypothetical protein
MNQSSSRDKSASLISALSFEDKLSNKVTLLRNLSIVIGSTILSIIGSDGLRYLNSIVSSKTVSPDLLDAKLIFTLLVLSFVLLLYGFDIFTIASRDLRRFCRSKRFGGYLIGILYERDQDIERVWSNIAPEEWATLIEQAAESSGKKIAIDFIQTNKAFDRYHVIINPYGGNYPETSFDDFPVYEKTLEYIRAGGFFVNVADIPTYWSYNPRLRRKIDRTPAVYGTAGEESRLFSRTPLMQELAVKVYNVEKNSAALWPFNLKAPYAKCRDNNFVSLKPSRAAVVERNVESVVEPIDGLTPLFFCSYGDGRCLISLSWLDGNFTQNRPLSGIISNLVINQL